MDKAPERIWASKTGTWLSCESPSQLEPAEYVRADLYEQAKRERDDAKQALQNEIVAHGNTIRGKAERLAGVRVKVNIEGALREWHRVHWTDDDIRQHIPAVRRTIESLEQALSALAEPAGEAEPCQFLPTEDGEFNGNTTETPIAAEDGREVDWIDVIGWGLYKGHAIPVDVARYIATKINLYAEHRTTPPDASAIREALADDLVGRIVDDAIIRCRALPGCAARPAWETAIEAAIRAALAGAKP